MVSLFLQLLNTIATLHPCGRFPTLCRLPGPEGAQVKVPHGAGEKLGSREAEELARGQCVTPNSWVVGCPRGGAGLVSAAQVSALWAL